MQINKCIIAKPGLFDNKSIEFKNGINIIYGKNGSGKSLIARALLEVLWGQIFQKTLLKKSLWDNLYFEAHISDSANDYRFIKNSDKNFSIKHISNSGENEMLNMAIFAEKTDVQGDNPLSEMKSRADNGNLSQIYRKINIDEYFNSSFISSPTEISRDNNLNYDIIKRILLDDNSLFYSLYRNIRESYDRQEMNKRVQNIITNEILKTESTLKELYKNIQIIDIQKSKSEKLAKEKKQIEDDLASIEKESQEMQTAREQIQKALADIEKLDNTEKRINEIKAELKESREKSDAIINKEKQIKTLYTQFQDFSESKKENLKKLQETYRQIRDIHIAMDLYVSEKNQKRKRANYISFFIAVVCSTILYFILNKKFFMLSHSVKFNIAAGLGIFTVFSIIVLHIPVLIPLRSRGYKDLIKKKWDIEKNLSFILHENNIELYDYRLEAVYEFLLQYFEEYGEFTEQQLELFMLKESVKNSDHIDSIKSELEKLEQERDVLKNRISIDPKLLPDYDPGAIDKDKILKLLDDIEKKSYTLKENQEHKIKTLHQIIDDICNTIDYETERNKLANLTAKAEEKHKRLSSHNNYMQLIIELFEEVTKEREEHQFTGLLKSAKDNFNIITNNQFITVLDDDMVKKFFIEHAEPIELNSALLYILMLSIKLAISQFLYDSNISVPLIIDDPFVFMDDTRVENFNLILQRISQQRQVIIFTQHSHYMSRDYRVEL